MLRHADDSGEGERIDYGRLLERLAQDGRQWAEAELTLARIELSSLKSLVLRIAILAAIALAAMVCALVALSQAAIAGLASVVGSAGLAALLVALLLAAVAAIALWAMRAAMSWRAESIFLRWLGQTPARSGER